ncbi:hypothetical protein [Streptomyces sp. URMC 123]|uniref:hypothetical protein n=1 Tax=Streptomyces sp. URMC 123 TaxID=3423403 RepID=UPI003F1DC6D0
MQSTSLRRGLALAAAWSLATGAATALSWWGVHTVLAGTAYDPPSVLAGEATGVSPSPGGASGAPPAPGSSAGRSPGPSGQPGQGRPSGAPGSPEAPRSPDAHSPAPPSGAPASPSTRSSTAAGAVRNYTVPGGRVVFDLGAASAGLVSATPDAGWRMQVWTQPQWIRVDFTLGERTSSVFCTWNGHPPQVETVPG